MAPETDFPVFAEPGDSSGIYYIIVAGLPWNCSWQELKDYTRKAPDGSKINVDHVVVYKGLTNGWVRVRDKTSFQKALKHLDGGVLNGHALLADGRNETMWTHLRSLDPPPQDTRQSRGSDTWNESPSAQQTQPQQPQVTDPGYIYATPESTPATPHFAPFYTDWYTPTYYYTPHQLPFQPPNTPQHPPFMSPVPLTQGLPLSYIPLSPPTPTQTYHPWSPPTHPPQTQHQNQPQKQKQKPPQKTIIIKKLPPNTDITALQHFLHATLPHTCGTPESIEIPTCSRDRSRRQAFVGFSDGVCARNAVEALDGVRFLDRVLVGGGDKRRGGSGFGRKGVDGYVLRSLKDAGTLKGVGKEEVYFPSVEYVDGALDLSGEKERLEVCVKRERGSGTPMIVDGSSSCGKGRV